MQSRALGYQHCPVVPFGASGLSFSNLVHEPLRSRRHCRSCNGGIVCLPSCPNVTIEQCNIHDRSRVVKSCSRWILLLQVSLAIVRKKEPKRQLRCRRMHQRSNRVTIWGSTHTVCAPGAHHARFWTITRPMVSPSRPPKWCPLEVSEVCQNYQRQFQISAEVLRVAIHRRRLDFNSWWLVVDSWRLAGSSWRVAVNSWMWIWWQPWAVPHLPAALDASVSMMGEGEGLRTQTCV